MASFQLPFLSPQPSPKGPLSSPKPQWQLPAYLAGCDYELLAPPNFTAMHTRDWLYVESLTGEQELYNRRTDPLELVNVIETAPPETVLALKRQFEALRTCAGSTCRVADSMQVP